MVLERVVILTGPIARIGSFCLVIIGIFVIAEIFVLDARFRYRYRAGLDNILVLLIGGIPIAMLVTVL